MDNNEQVINNFYSAFQQRDHKKMNDCYSDDVVFFDPVFGLLQAQQVKKMWEMLCTNATDLSIIYGNIQNLGDDYYICDWEATYTFSKTGRKVVNKIKAHMRFSEGEIVEHSDGFSVHKWSKQAIGFTGVLFGWNSFFQKKIRNMAHMSLLNFITKQENQAII
ncbi:MAG: nuclear transport factor 2 family protein [Ferruginibacter sp.]